MSRERELSPMKVQAVDHVSFTVSDIERSVDFYSALLGAGPLAVGTDSAEVAARVIGYPEVTVRFAYFSLPGIEAVLELFQDVEPQTASHALETRFVGNGHLGLVVDDLAIA